MYGNAAVLPERRQAVLRIIVSEYIASGLPVGSEFIARGHHLRVSPATIRNEMASLEEEGYIVRPHTSAGGLPSDRGYRFYVEGLIRGSELDAGERRAIRELFRAAGQEPDEWARTAVSVLTRRLRTIALATSVRAPFCHFRRIDIIALGGMFVLMILVLQEWRIKQRLMALKRQVGQDRLGALANKMNDLFVGLTSDQIRSRMEGLSGLETEIGRTVVDMMEAEDRQSHEQFYMDGWRYLLGRQEFATSRRVEGLARALEEGSLMQRLLERLDDQSQVRVIIGRENEEDCLQDCSVILAGYGTAEQRGAIGIIGPTRMAYNRAIPVIEYVSMAMSGLVREAYA